MKWGQQELIHQWTVVFLLWLPPAVSSVMTTITAQCTDTATLPCTAMRQERYTYRAVSWYKVIDKTNWIGIIRKTESQIQLYNDFPGSVTLAEHDSLIIAHVTAEDAGIYRCSLLAFLGGTNQEGHVSLNVSVCLPPDPVTSPAAASPGTSPNASWSVTAAEFCLCVPSAMRGVTCLSILAVLNIVKGLACYCSIWALRRMRCPKQETKQADVNVEDRMVQSLREHIQRFSVEKHQRNTRIWEQMYHSRHSVYSE